MPARPLIFWGFLPKLDVRAPVFQILIRVVLELESCMTHIVLVGIKALDWFHTLEKQFGNKGTHCLAGGRL
jgi:hypothetical protein